MTSDALLVPLFGALIVGAASGTRDRFSFLSTPLMTQLGEASYALYILHIPLAFWWQKAERLGGFAPFGNWFSILAFSIFAIVLSYIVFVTIERPFRRRIQRWNRTRSASAASEFLPAKHAKYAKQKKQKAGMPEMNHPLNTLKKTKANKPLFFFLFAYLACLAGLLRFPLACLAGIPS